ncbi:SseB family protein [Planosporangium sp. 12N6]|uniref:SseB family protein n=1 Tax=Planosporangium spinosum TaxID=3402278 RepID=UPI003CF0F0BC
MSEWEPATETEAAMRDALRAGDQEQYFRLLARAELVLPVDAEAFAGRAPAGWGTWTTESRTHVLAFTSPAALAACLAEHAGTFRTLPFHDLAIAWPDVEWWLAVNPGLPIEGYLPPWFVAQISRGDVRLPGRTLGARARMEQAVVSRASGAPAAEPPTGRGSGVSAGARGSGLSSADGSLRSSGGRALSRRAELLGRHGFQLPGSANAPRPDNGRAIGATPDNGRAIGATPDNGRAIGATPDNGRVAAASPGDDGPDHVGAVPYPAAGAGHAPSGTAVQSRPQAPDHVGGADYGPGTDPVTPAPRHGQPDPVAPTASVPEPRAAGSPAYPAHAPRPAPAARPGSTDLWDPQPQSLPTDRWEPQPAPASRPAPAGGPPAGTPSAQPAPAPTAVSAPAPAPAAVSAPAPAPAAVSAPAPDFTAANQVEESLLEAASEGSTDSFLSTLLLAKVLVPGPHDDAIAHIDQWRTEEIEGQPYVVVFTSAERLRAHLGEDRPADWIKFTQLINAWPREALSFAVNPGTPIGATLPGSQVVALAAWAAGEGLTDERPEPEAPAPEPEPPRPESTPSPPVGPVVMQKTIPASQVPYYLDRGYDRISGFVHRASEVTHLRTPTELYNALGLNYSDSKFSPDDPEVYVLRWAAHRGNLYRIPYGGQHEAAMHAMQGWVIERAPFRGNGFAPSESRDVIAEFKVDSARLPHGAELWQVDRDGNEKLVAVFDADWPRWQRVGEQ